MESYCGCVEELKPSGIGDMENSFGSRIRDIIINFRTEEENSGGNGNGDIDSSPYKENDQRRVERYGHFVLQELIQQFGVLVILSEQQAKVIQNGFVYKSQKGCYDGIYIGPSQELGVDITTPIFINFKVREEQKTLSSFLSTSLEELGYNGVDSEDKGLRSAGVIRAWGCTNGHPCKFDTMDKMDCFMFVGGMLKSLNFHEVSVQKFVRRNLWGQYKWPPLT